MRGNILMLISRRGAVFAKLKCSQEMREPCKHREHFSTVPSFSFSLFISLYLSISLAFSRARLKKTYVIRYLAITTGYLRYASAYVERISRDIDGDELNSKEIANEKHRRRMPLALCRARNETRTPTRSDRDRLLFLHRHADIRSHRTLLSPFSLSHVGRNTTRGKFAALGQIFLPRERTRWRLYFRS